MARSYETEEIEITFDPRKCIHSRKCVLRLPEVFDAGGGRDWIKPGGAAPDEIASIGRACPSGAITFRREDGGPQEGRPKINTVRLWENGPLEVRADLQIAGAEQVPRAVLCRCGLSDNKPWCDGSHTRGFEATGEQPPAEEDEGRLENRGGPLNVVPQLNGPFQFAGNLEIVSGSGARIARTTEAWLCRCGHSKNKPFCDGSHKEVGFKADGAGD